MPIMHNEAQPFVRGPAMTHSRDVASNKRACYLTHIVGFSDAGPATPTAATRSGRTMSRLRSGAPTMRSSTTPGKPYRQSWMSSQALGGTQSNRAHGTMLHQVPSGPSSSRPTGQRNNQPIQSRTASMSWLLCTLGSPLAQKIGLLQDFANTNRYRGASASELLHWCGTKARSHPSAPAKRHSRYHSPTGTLRLLPAESAPLIGWHNPTPTIASTQEVEYNSPAPPHYGAGRPPHIEALHRLTQQAQAAKGALPRLTYPQSTPAQATSFYSNPNQPEEAKLLPLFQFSLLMCRKLKFPLQPQPVTNQASRCHYPSSLS
jgi:hypothetical protein